MELLNVTFFLLAFSIYNPLLLASKKPKSGGNFDDPLYVSLSAFKILTFHTLILVSFRVSLFGFVYVAESLASWTCRAMFLLNLGVFHHYLFK
jgi:hypothetical protein